MKKINRYLQAIFKKVLDMYAKSLTNKLILIFTSIIIITLIPLSFISYNMIENESFDNEVKYNTNTLRVVNKEFETYLENIRNLSMYQFNYDNIMDALENQSHDYSQKAYLEEYMKGLFYSRDDIEGLYLYIIKDKKYYYISRKTKDRNVRICDTASIEEENWYRKIINNKKNSYIEPLALVNKNELGYIDISEASALAYHHTLINITHRKPEAIVSVYFNSSNIDKIIKDVPIENGEDIVLMNSENNPLYINKYDEEYGQKLQFYRDIDKYVGKGGLKWSTNKAEYLVISNVSDNFALKLIKLIPYDEIKKAADKNKNISLAVGITFVSLAIILIIFTSNAITTQLKKLLIYMKKFGEGNLNVNIEIKGKDEIWQLSEQFNTMVKQINVLFDERYKMKLIEKSAILRALDSEINPHFLYNALQAISTQALKNGIIEVYDMIDALSSIFRYCIGEGDMVRIDAEINHVKRYILLQEARFGDKLEVYYNIDSSLNNVQIPKLAIQTLIENSIKHSVEQVASKIKILVDVYSSNSKVIIVVKDNGRGIKPEIMKSIISSFSESWEARKNKYLGLKNLNTRLKIIFGDEAELSIDSDITGTEIRILIPMEVKA